MCGVERIPKRIVVAISSEPELIIVVAKGANRGKNPCRQSLRRREEAPLYSGYRSQRPKNQGNKSTIDIIIVIGFTASNKISKVLLTVPQEAVEKIIGGSNKFRTQKGSKVA